MKGFLHLDILKYLHRYDINTHLLALNLNDKETPC